MPDTGSQKPVMRPVWHSWAWGYGDNLKLTPFAAEVARACRMDFVPMMRLGLRWMIRRPASSPPRHFLDPVNARAMLALMSKPSTPQVASVSRPSRFFTREVAMLRRNFRDTPSSHCRMRVLFEIASGADLTACDIAKALDFDVVGRGAAWRRL